MMGFLDSLPKWLLGTISILLIVLLGYIDWVTGDYSILIFYLIPIFLVSWFGGRGIGILICIAAGYARFLSNIPLHDFSLMNYWNSAGDMFFFLIICLLVYHLRKALE